MRTATRIFDLRARSLRIALLAAVSGLAPLAASSAASPADGALPVDASIATGEIAAAAEIVQLPEPPLAEPAPSVPTEVPSTTSLGRGVASYYAQKFHGRRTASGETFDNGAMTAAHRTLPFGSLVRVTNPANGKAVVVRINDRGPFTRGRAIDVSRAAAEELGLITRGHAAVELELIES